MFRFVREASRGVADRSGSDPQPPSRLVITGLGVLIVAASWWVAIPALQAPFYFDSQVQLVQQTDLHLRDLSWPSVSDLLWPGAQQYRARPLSRLSLAATYRYFGNNPAAYRAGNLLIHWCGAAMVLLLVSGLCGTPRVRARHPEIADARFWLALIAASLWGMHPIQTNVTTYVIQRMASLAGVFSFLSLWAYVRARSTPSGWSWGWAVTCVLGMGLALASKETALSTTPLFLLIEVYLFGPERGPGLRRALPLLSIALVALLAAATLLLDLPALLGYLKALYAGVPYSPWERVLSEVRLQLRYALALLLPSPRFLTLVGHEEISRGLLSPLSTGVAVLLCGGAVWVAVRTRKRWPLLGFSILWFFLAQCVEATVLPLDLYAEYRIYVASVPVFLGLAVLLRRVGRFFPRGEVAFFALAACLLTVEGHATLVRNRTWADPVAFWGDAARKDPLDPRAAGSLGHALLHAGRFREGEAALARAVSLGGSGEPGFRAALAYAALREGKLDEARSQLAAAQARLHGGGNVDDNSRVLVFQGLALLDMQDGHPEEARRHLREILGDGLAEAETSRLLGVSYLLERRPKDALAPLGRAVRLDPQSAVAWNNLGTAYAMLQRADSACLALGKAAQLAPRNAKFLQDLKALSPKCSGSAGNP